MGIDLNGSAWCNGLVPCLPEDADDSATTLVTKVETNPDLKIVRLLYNQDKVSGIVLNWQTDITYVLEASDNLTTWHDVSTFTAPSGTVYFSSLDEPGPFFRVRIWDGSSSFTLSTITSLAANQKLIAGTKLEVNEGKAVAVFPSEEGKIYTVDFLSAAGKLLKQVSVPGSPLKTSVAAPTGLPAGPVLIRVSTPSTVTH